MMKSMMMVEVGTWMAEVKNELIILQAFIISLRRWACSSNYNWCMIECVERRSGPSLNQQNDQLGLVSE